MAIQLNEPITTQWRDGSNIRRKQKKINVLRAVLSGKETRHRSGLAAAAAT
jgi:hypothetical protein